MYKNFVKIISIGFVLVGLFFMTDNLQAVDLEAQVGAQLDAGLERSGLGNASSDPRIIAASFVQFFLGLLATIFLIMIAMSSFWYITARGQEQKIAKATSTIRGAVIGLIIVIMAYSITYFVSKNVQKAAVIPTSAHDIILPIS